VAGLGIRLYTDEDVDPRLACQLGGLGYDALSCTDSGNHNQKFDDEWQLQFAVSQQRVILTHNNGDYTRLDRQWRESGQQHFGIILVVNATPMGELVRRVGNHLDIYTPEDHHNMLLWLG
jgi:predicted nuclease of predicted toxin-antitoxin system